MIFGEKSLPGKWSILTVQFECVRLQALSATSPITSTFSLSVQTRAYLIRPSNVCKLNERGTANWMAFAYTGTSPPMHSESSSPNLVCARQTLLQLVLIARPPEPSRRHRELLQTSREEFPHLFRSIQNLNFRSESGWDPRASVSTGDSPGTAE